MARNLVMDLDDAAAAVKFRIRDRKLGMRSRGEIALGGVPP